MCLWRSTAMCRSSQGSPLSIPSTGQCWPRAASHLPTPLQDLGPTVRAAAARLLLLFFIFCEKHCGGFLFVCFVLEEKKERKKEKKSCVVCSLLYINRSYVAVSRAGPGCPMRKRWLSDVCISISCLCWRAFRDKVPNSWSIALRVFLSHNWEQLSALQTVCRAAVFSFPT